MDTLGQIIIERLSSFGGKNVFPLQWNPSNQDTIGSAESVLISEVSLFQGLKSTQTRSFGRKNVSCLERCPYFRGVLIEGFHCI